MPPAANKVGWPGDTDRTVIIGMTGSGKTRLALRVFATQNYTDMPWVIFDFKDEELFTRIPFSTRWDLNAAPPVEPGIYIVPVAPHELAEFDAFVAACHAQTHIGLWVDEGAHEAPVKSKSLNAVLTQGRSRHVPVIVLTQRAAWVSRYVFSEATFIISFNLTVPADRKRVMDFTRGAAFDMSRDIADFHARYYDVRKRQAEILRPAPPEAETLAVIGARLAPQEVLVNTPMRRFL